MLPLMKVYCIQRLNPHLLMLGQYYCILGILDILFRHPHSNLKWWRIRILNRVFSGFIPITGSLTTFFLEIYSFIITHIICSEYYLFMAIDEYLDRLLSNTCRTMDTREWCYWGKSMNGIVNAGDPRYRYLQAACTSTDYRKNQKVIILELTISIYPISLYITVIYPRAAIFLLKNYSPM